MNLAFRIFGVVFIVAVSSAMAFSVTPAIAATPDCSFKDQIGQLEALRAVNEGGYRADSIRAELALRQDILRRTLDCASYEVENLRTKVGALKNLDKPSSDLQSQFLRELDEALQFYGDEHAKIATLGLRGSQDMAREIKERRASTYAPMTEEVLHFLIWVKNQDLFRAARLRFADIEKTIQALKLADDEDMGKLIADANANLEAANRFNVAAQDALGQFPPRDNTFELIKQSLESLAKTYQNFFEVSDAAQKVLPSPR